MLRLYVRFYIALLASLALFGLAAGVLVHFASGPMEQVGATVGRLVQNVLPPASAPAPEQQLALQKLAAGLKADVTLFAQDGTVIAAIGRPLPIPDARRSHLLSFKHWQGGTVSSVRLADGQTAGCRSCNRLWQLTLEFSPALDFRRRKHRLGGVSHCATVERPSRTPATRR